MVCALTVRTLKPGTFQQFREEFLSGIDGDDPPHAWVRFNMVRNADDPDEVACFGFFDGTIDELRAESDPVREEQLRRIAPFVESIEADGLYDVVEDLTIARSPA
jgi:hypothetical protein